MAGYVRTYVRVISFVFLSKTTTHNNSSELSTAAAAYVKIYKAIHLKNLKQLKFINCIMIEIEILL